jgi:hypothetical protein
MIRNQEPAIEQPTRVADTITTLADAERNPSNHSRGDPR